MLLLSAAVAHLAGAQTPEALPSRATPLAASSATVVPMLVRYDGAAVQGDGSPKTGSGPVTFLVYKEEQGGDPLWTETQSVVFDQSGKYEVYLGSTSSSGLPADLFGSGEARWLEVQIAGEPVQPRTLLTSVPYALHAADAATLGGLPASAFMRAAASGATSVTAPDAVTAASASAVTTTGGTTGLVPLFTGPTTVGNSIIYANANSVGIGLPPSIYGVLDVGGESIFRGALNLARTGNASASTGTNSNPFTFSFQFYNSADKFVFNPYFGFQAEATGNNTANPAGTMNLLYYNGIGGVPKETGLYFNTDGTIHFSPNQTFPLTSSTGTALTGTSGSGTGVQGTSTSATGVAGTSTTGSGMLGYTSGSTLNTAGVLGGAGGSSGFGGIAGVWGDAFSHVGVLGTSYQYSGVQGISYVGPGMQGQSTTNVGVQGTSDTGPGVTGTSNVGDGIQGITQGISLYTAGVMGSAGARTSFGGIAGVWGDAASHVGVLGSSNQYAGVQGLSTQGQGVQGQSTSNSGVQGTSTSGTGVAGTSTTANGVLGYTAGGTSNTGGVVGQAGGTSGFGGIAGVWGDASAYVGVFGSSNQYAGVDGISNYSPGVVGSSTYASGVYGSSNDTNASDDVAGVYGFASGALPAVKGRNSGSGPAAIFSSSSPNVATLTAYNNASTNGTGTAVLGVGSEGDIGVEGETIGGIAVLGAVGLTAPGNRLSGYAGNVAVFGDATLLDGVAVIGSTSDNNAAYFSNNSSSDSTIYARNYGSGNTGQDVALFGALEAATPNGTCGFGGNGDLTCTGQVKTLATTGSGARTVETYSMQSPENWMEDFGSATLQNGRAFVSIDAAFAETVSGGADYHVFLTPRGDSKGLYVTNTTATGFEVRESGGGTSTLGFDYRIVAKRRGFESQRMVDVTDAMKSVKARNDLQAARFKSAARSAP